MELGKIVARLAKNPISIGGANDKQTSCVAQRLHSHCEGLFKLLTSSYQSFTYKLANGKYLNALILYYEQMYGCLFEMCQRRY